MNKIEKFLDRYKDFGILFLRLVVGWRLIAGAGPYAIGDKPMQELTGYFTQLDIPIPGVAAIVSVYAQCIGGILFLVGLWTRPAAMVMIINFTIALITAHRQDGIEKAFAPWILLASAIFLLFNGPGKLSAGPVIERRTG